MQTVKLLLFIDLLSAINYLDPLHCVYVLVVNLIYAFSHLFSQEYGVEYFKKFDVVMNALDNRGNLEDYLSVLKMNIHMYIVSFNFK